MPSRRNVTILMYRVEKLISTKFPCKETLDGDDEQVKFYTGLPTFVTLMAIFCFVSSHFGSSDTSRLLAPTLSAVYVGADETLAQSV